MKPCRVCRTLYPEIVPGIGDICGDCLSEPDLKSVSLHDLAVEMEQELEQWQCEQVLALAEVHGR